MARQERRADRPKQAGVLLLGVAGLMTFVALLATIGPARRGVRIQAIEALRVQA